jgi:hypothetical protein
MRFGIIAALFGAVLFAAGVQAADGGKPPPGNADCDNLGRLLAEICQLDGQDGLECVREDMQKAGYVEGKDYSVLKDKLVCKQLEQCGDAETSQ